MNVPLNIDWQQILLHLFNFVILFAILYFLLYEPIKKFMDKRCEYYKNIENETKKNLQHAEEIKKEYEQKLSCADSEIDQKKHDAYKALSERTAQIEILARQQAEAIVSDAREKAENEHNKIIEDAQSQIVDMAATVVKKIVADESTSDAYDSFLSLVKRGESDE